ncbi:hypothetical protein [uncultured Pseudonocardia sp.]|uniref:hypothetical protein n=1 Tax=uncultured Pseudonocardia sp. TaxID=211455 RepID=UPI002623E52E|nr:hypothetical protein [uncultured Pseudonocardia sp.]
MAGTPACCRCAKPSTSAASSPPPPTIGARRRHDVTTTFLEEPVAAVRARVAASSHDFALVLATATLLGRLQPSALDSADPDHPAGQVMEPPRPHEPARDGGERLAQRHLSYASVTDPEGRLLDTVHPSDLHRRPRPIRTGGE